MDFLSLFIGAVASLFTILLAVITLGGIIRKIVTRWFLELLLQTGLIKYDRDAVEPKVEWPNGSSNLPDLLDNMYCSLEELKKGQISQETRDLARDQLARDQSR